MRLVHPLPGRTALDRPYMSAIEAGEGRAEDMDRLRAHARWIGGPDSTFCALAPGPWSPFKAHSIILKMIFGEHIRLGRCPYRPEGGVR